MPENLYPEHKSMGVNERFRFLRYDQGMFFKPHFDGAYVVPNSEPLQETKITLQLYLNEGFKGGSTTFMGSDKNIECVPKIGKALLF